MQTQLLLAALALLQLLAGIASLLLVLAAVGVGPHSDAYVAAQAVPSVLTAILAVSLQSVWQPRLSLATEPNGQWQAAHRVAHAQALAVFGCSGLALAVTAPLWTAALFAGFAADVRALVLQMTPPLLIAAAFNGASAVLTTAQRGRDRLVSPEVVGLLGSLLGVAAIGPAVSTGGVVAAAWVMLGRAALVWLGLLALVGGSGPSWRAGWHDRELWRQLRPLLGSAAVSKTAPLVDRFWSALAPAGSVTLFGLAQTGMGALAAVFDRALCMPAAPQIARRLAEGNAPAARRLYRRSMLVVALASAAVALVLLLSKPWWDAGLAVALGMQQTSASGLWVLCTLLLGYLFVAAAGTVVVSVFYALGDTRTPATIGLVGFCVGVLAKSAGFLLLGIQGLALATSLYYLANLVALVLALERRLGRLPDANQPG